MDPEGLEKQEERSAEYLRREQAKAKTKAAGKGQMKVDGRQRNAKAITAETWLPSSGDEKGKVPNVLGIPGGNASGPAHSSLGRTPGNAASSSSAIAAPALVVVQLPKNEERLRAPDVAAQLLQPARANILSLEFKKAFIEFCSEEISRLSEHDAGDCLAIRPSREVDAASKETMITIHNISRLAAQLQLEVHV